MDKCPVCGMFVYKYPDWTAEIIFEEGAVFYFDGAKDFFKFYFNLRYFPYFISEDCIIAIDGFCAFFLARVLVIINLVLFGL